MIVSRTLILWSDKWLIYRIFTTLFAFTEGAFIAFISFITFSWQEKNIFSLFFLYSLLFCSWLYSLFIFFFISDCFHVFLRSSNSIIKNFLSIDVIFLLALSSLLSNFPGHILLDLIMFLNLGRSSTSSDYHCAKSMYKRYCRE